LNSVKQILITGIFRSGTTLIAQIIKNHPKIEMVYDSVNFMRFSFGMYDPLEKFENVKSLIKEIHERIAQRWDMHFDYEKVLNTLKKQEISYKTIYNTLMNNLLLTGSNAIIWGEKTTLVWSKIPHFFEMFPDGGVIHIIRDPRAIITSWSKMTHAPGYDYLDAIFNCLDSMDKMKKYKEIFKERRYIPIKYEDLVMEPVRIVSKICTIFGIDFYEEMLNYNHFIDKSGQKWKGNSMFTQDIKGISTQTMDLWKDQLSDWEIWLIEFFNEKMMDYFNYKRVNVIPTENVIKQVMKNIKSSPLLIDGVLNYLFKGKGIERFPSDPLDPKTWDNGEKEYSKVK